MRRPGTSFAAAWTIAALAMTVAAAAKWGVQHGFSIGPAALADPADLIVVGIGLAAFAAGLAAVGWQAFRRHAGKRAARAKTRASEASRQSRIARLAADPATQKYATLIAKGERWSDEQIAYDRDPDAVATCPHLAPIERAMRRAGMPVRLFHAATIRADCRVDRDGLARGTPPVPPAEYYERIERERFGDQIPAAGFSCRACPSWIRTLHPWEAKPDSAWFPDAPNPPAGS